MEILFALGMFVFGVVFFIWFAATLGGINRRLKEISQRTEVTNRLLAGRAEHVRPCDGCTAINPIEALVCAGCGKHF